MSVIMLNPVSGPGSLGASPDYLEIDLAANEPPFTFREKFAAAYPTVDWPQILLSRTIVVVTGTGSLTFKTATGYNALLSLKEDAFRGIQAVGITARNTISKIQVYL